MNKDLKLLEAIIFASGEPVDEKDLKEKIMDKKNLVSYLNELQKFYSSRGINLLKTGTKWSFRTSNELSDNLTIFKTQKRKLSRAALETLSIIAYMQPVTRGDIEDIRGVNVATNIIKLLIDQGWIKIKGYRDVPGRPALFITTQKFLDDFSMKNLSELPALPDLPEIENISPELTLQDDSIEQEAPKS